MNNKRQSIKCTCGDNLVCTNTRILGNHIKEFHGCGNCGETITLDIKRSKDPIICGCGILFCQICKFGFIKSRKNKL